jgi:PAS domain S-box-containing protein
MLTLSAAGDGMGQPHLGGMPRVLIALIVIASLAVACSVILARRLFAMRNRGRNMQRVFDLFNEGARDYALWVLGAEGRILHWSAGAERIHGYSAAEMIGRHCSMLYTEQDRDAHVPQRLLEQAARLGSCAITGTRVRKQGDPLTAESVLHALRDEAGELTGFCEIERDVSDRMQLERSLQQTQAALLQSHKLEAVGRLSRGVAHDFNNVIQVIKNCVRVLQRRLADQPQLLQLLDMMERNADRAAGLSQHLLDFARLEPAESRVTNVHEVVAHTAELLRHTLAESIVLEQKLGSTVPWTSIDRAQLEAALLNLAADARDAMPGGGTLSIETANGLLPGSEEEAGNDSGQYVTIKVSDSRSDPTHAPATLAAATGDAASLGLTQIHQVLELVGGRVDVKRQPDGGASVTLWLPCARVPEAQPLPGEPRPSTVASGAP